MQVFAGLGTREVTEKVQASILNQPLKVPSRENGRKMSAASSGFACLCKRGEDRRGNTVIHRTFQVTTCQDFTQESQRDSSTERYWGGFWEKLVKMLQRYSNIAYLCQVAQHCIPMHWKSTWQKVFDNIRLKDAFHFPGTHLYCRYSYASCLHKTLKRKYHKTLKSKDHSRQQKTTCSILEVENKLF